MATPSTCSRLVLDALSDMNQHWQLEHFRNPAESTSIYGPGSPLDSMQLVSLIALIEEKVEEHCQALVSIADERAMSRRHSPFLTVSSLASYLEELLAADRP